MKRIIIYMILVMAILTMTGTVAQASELPDIDLPSTWRVDPADLSGGLFERVFGEPWREIIGDSMAFETDSDGNQIKKQTGTLAHLILAVVQMINMAAMAFAATFLLYNSGVAAVATAHEGERIGGGMIDSLWYPVRACFGLTMCVPVYSGLSLLQIIMIAVIGFGINAGNQIWKVAAETVIEEVGNVERQEPSPMVFREAVESVQPLFQGVMLQEVIRIYSSEYFPNMAIKSHELPTWVPREMPEMARSLSVEGDYVIEYRALEGKLILWLMPSKDQTLGTFGGISIPAPKLILDNDRNLTMPQDHVAYNAALQVARIRAKEMINIAEGLRKWAQYYIEDKGISYTGQARPAEDGIALAEAYRDAVSSAAVSHIKTLRESKGDVSKRIRKALGVKDSGDIPAGGWMAAGILPTVLAVASEEKDIVSYGGGVRPMLVTDASAGIYNVDEDHHFLGTITNWLGARVAISKDGQRLLKASPRLATQELLGGRSYTGHSEDGDLPGLTSRGLASVFYGEDLANTGILGATMRNFSEKNPISAMVDFGHGCLKGGAWMLGGSSAAGIAGQVPGWGWINEIVNNPLAVAGMIALCVLGLLLTFVVPATPLLVWIKAVLLWVWNSIEAVMAAPLFAVAHMMPEGKGFAGQHARRGYLQLLDIAIRPAWLTLYICLLYLLLDVTMAVVTDLFSIWVNAMGGYDDLGFFWELMMSIMFIVTIYMTFHFLVTHLLLHSVKNAIQWIGGQASTVGTAEQSSQREQTVVGGVVGKGAAVAGGVGGYASGMGGGHNNDNSGSSNEKPKKPKGGQGPAYMSPDPGPDGGPSGSGSGGGGIADSGPFAGPDGGPSFDGGRPSGIRPADTGRPASGGGSPSGTGTGYRSTTIISDGGSFSDPVGTGTGSMNDAGSGAGGRSGGGPITGNTRPRVTSQDRAYRPASIRKSD